MLLSGLSDLVVSYECLLMFDVNGDYQGCNVNSVIMHKQMGIVSDYRNTSYSISSYAFQATMPLESWDAIAGAYASLILRQVFPSLNCDFHALCINEKCIFQRPLLLRGLQLKLRGKFISTFPTDNSTERAKRHTLNLVNSSGMTLYISKYEMFLPMQTLDPPPN